MSEIPTVYPDEVYCCERTDACPSTCAAGERSREIADIPHWMLPRLIWGYLRQAGCCPDQSDEENERRWRTVHLDKVPFYQPHYEENRRRKQNG